MGRAEAETPPLTAMAAPNSPVTTPSANPVSYAHPIPGSAEWHARKVKQDLEDEKKDRALAKTISAICHGC
jgi:hypothetical protein